MKTALLLAGAAVMLAISSAPSFAVSKKAPAAPKKEVRCAIMKDNKVNVAAATKKKMFADHKGNRYFFCCAGCPEAFAKNPAKYAKADHIPTPKK
ncbi:MAG: YHS domain-containing protein [Actinomycetota bacterium]